MKKFILKCLIALTFIFSLFLLSCNNKNSNQTVDSTSATSMQPESTAIQNNDTLNISSRKKSTSVYEMWWPALDFLTKYIKSNSIAFELKPNHGGGYVIEGEQINGKDTVPVTLNKVSTEAIIITSTLPDNKIWHRLGKLNKEEIKAFLDKIIKETNFSNLNVNPNNYRIVITPIPDTQDDEGITEQFIGFKLSVESNVPKARSLTYQKTNPCPKCGKEEVEYN